MIVWTIESLLTDAETREQRWTFVGYANLGERDSAVGVAQDTADRFRKPARVQAEGFPPVVRIPRPGGEE